LVRHSVRRENFRKSDAKIPAFPCEERDFVENVSQQHDAAGDPGYNWVFPEASPVTIPAETHPTACPRHRVDPIRLWLAAMGVMCVGLGAVGVFVPGLPTTIFLILASWCFARSCPWLERRLIRNRFFRPFLPFLEPGAVMPTRARVITTVALWAGVGLSVALMASRHAAAWVPALVVACGVIGTITVWRIARGGTPRVVVAAEAA